MIDYETEIFNAVYPVVSPLVGEKGFRSTHTLSPTIIPSQTLFEISNRTDGARNTNSPEEDYVIVGYEAHTYANTKAECRKIFGAMDNYLLRIGFTRISGDYIPNGGNVAVHEYVARYRAEIGRDGTIYRKR